MLLESIRSGAALRCVLAAALCITASMVSGQALAMDLTVAGFGNSFTCTACNDGGYLADSNLPSSASPVGVLEPSEIDSSWLDDELLALGILEPADVLTIDDNGVSASVTSDVLARLDGWIADGNTADWVIVIAGTPNTYQAVGGFTNSPYDEAATVADVQAIIDLIEATGSKTLLVAPPPVVSPCGNPVGLTCEEIDQRLADLAVEYAQLAVDNDIAFLDLHAAFVGDPAFGEAPGSANSLYRSDGLHPQYETGDALIAFLVAPLLAPGDEVGGDSPEIDIRPWSDENRLYTRRWWRPVPVAILGSKTFDVQDVDRSSLEFGPWGARPGFRGRMFVWDVNEDGFDDLISVYSMWRTGISSGDTEACLSGATLGGAAFEACDSVVVKRRR